MTLIRFYPNRLTVSVFRFILRVAVLPFGISCLLSACQTEQDFTTTRLIRLSESCFSCALDVERKGNNTD